MNKSRSDQAGESLQQRKARIILMGASLGALLGVLSSYLYTRTAEENDNADPTGSISTGQLIAIFLAIMGLIRQIAELGKPKKPGKK